MAGTGPAPGTRRLLAIVVIVVAGFLSLPIVATFLDGDTTEALVVPVQVALMAVVGALVGRVLPGIAGADATRPRGAVVGAVLGVAAALLAAAFFVWLLGGI
jgi:hypothetical protein